MVVQMETNLKSWISHHISSESSTVETQGQSQRSNMVKICITFSLTEFFLDVKEICLFNN